MTPTDPTRTRATADRPWAFLAVAAAIGVALASQRAAFVRAYAVDVLWWDGWDLHAPLFKGQGWWASFDQQHGPHRQGVGGLLLRALATATRWDARYDAAAVCAAVAGATGLAVWLAWRCGVRRRLLLAVPVVCLNARQCGAFVSAPNPSHGAIPLALLIGCGLAGFARDPRWRLGLIAGLTGLAIFTGFGLFAGVLTPVLIAVDGRAGDRRTRRAAVASLALIVACWGVFARHYWPDSASPKFRFPFHPAVDYLYWTAALLANAAGVVTLDDGPTPSVAVLAVGTGLAAAGVVVVLVRLRRVFRRGIAAEPTAAAVALLAGFTLLFAADAAVGRTPEGWPTGASSRYVTPCVPLLLALLLHGGTSARRWTRVATAVAAVLLALRTTTVNDSNLASVAAFRDGCLRWRAAYLATGTQGAADQLSGFRLYPHPDLDGRLRYLRDRGLNLFDPTVDFGPTPPGTGGR